MISGIVTVLLLVLFLGGWAWAWSPRRKRAFDDAARLALEDPLEQPPEASTLQPAARTPVGDPPDRTEASP